MMKNSPVLGSLFTNVTSPMGFSKCANLQSTGRLTDSSYSLKPSTHPVCQILDFFYSPIPFIGGKLNGVHVNQLNAFGAEAYGGVAHETLIEGAVEKAPESSLRGVRREAGRQSNLSRR